MAINFSGKSTSFFEKNGKIRYFSLARYALLEALKQIGAGHESRILLPTLICRDLLAPVNLIGATPYWYEVGEDLSPLLAPEFWPEADVVLMVNYFGFPQNLSIFQAYSERVGARIIEDNAHGFLSRDSEGILLGCRADFGIFSIRKTLRIPDGAALWVKVNSNVDRLPEQLPFIGVGVNSAQLKKFYIRSLPIVGEYLYKAITKFLRKLRCWISLVRKTKTNSSAEKSILIHPEPWSGLLLRLMRFDAKKEIQRRRSLYLRCLEKCEKFGGFSVFPKLPSNCTPYAYAFRGDQSVVRNMQEYANRQGFDMVLWPDLPEAIIHHAPKHYHNIYLINLTW